MIDYTDCYIETVSVHKVGNNTNDEELNISNAPLDISDMKIRELLIHYFLKPFPEPEFYNFTFSNGDFTLNPLFNYAKTLFEDPGSFQINSIHIAKQITKVTT